MQRCISVRPIMQVESRLLLDLIQTLDEGERAESGLLFKGTQLFCYTLGDVSPWCQCFADNPKIK